MKTEPNDVIEVDDEDECVESKLSGDKNEYDADEDTDLDKSAPVEEEESLNSSKEISFNEVEFKKHFKLLSWNIDGLDSTSLESRTIGVATTILQYAFSFFFFNNDRALYCENKKLRFCFFYP